MFGYRGNTGATVERKCGFHWVHDGHEDSGAAARRAAEDRSLSGDTYRACDEDGRVLGAYKDGRPV